MDTDIVQQALDGFVDIEDVVRQWEKAYKEETLAYAPSEQVSNEEVMADVYQRVLLSPAVQQLLDQEYGCSLHMKELSERQERQWSDLTLRQTDELQAAVELLDEVEVNAISARHCEQRQLLESGWESRLESLQESQRLHFREWLLGMAEIVETGGGRPPPPPPAADKLEKCPDDSFPADSVFRLEESFTIQLGAQMKQSHNLRLISADVLDLCRPPLSARHDPQRLQMALSLYSSDLSGLVLLVDDRLSAYTGMEKEFLRVSQRAAELHFARADRQLEAARATFHSHAATWRQRADLADAGTRNGDGQWNGGGNGGSSHSGRTPRIGDLYVSRHSNLAHVHVVFHLVGDDSLRSADLNSRHPVLLGLRHILRTAVVADVTTLTLPLLLVHELSEEMTIAWCLRRAELVFKCVKGFMMELASYGGGVDVGLTSTRARAASPTLQFLLPRDAADDVFFALAAMLPGVFRVSNPLVLRSDPAAAASASD